MGTAKVIDFDAWRKEHAIKVLNEEPDQITFKVGGKEYPLPPEPPAIVVLDVLLLKDQEGMDADVPATTLMRIGKALFGEEAFREILEENRLSATDVGPLIVEALGAWPEQVTSTEDIAPNPEAPTTGAVSTPSETGPSLKPISNESTELT